MILRSWKEIANYLRCGVRTAQRWENQLGLPIRRPGAPDRSVIMAFTEELDQWAGRINPSASDMVQSSLAAQSDLRQELSDLRLKQRQLIETLRRNVKTVRTSMRKSDEIRRDTGGGPGLVLNVDDNLTQCYVIEKILRKAGFTVRLAHTAADALEIARRENPALVLLDIHLPDLPGYELFAMLRNNPETKEIPVLFYTALAPSDSADFVAGKLGAEGFFTPPIEATTLLSLVQQTIHRQSAAGTHVV